MKKYITFLVLLAALIAIFFNESIAIVICAAYIVKLDYDVVKKDSEIEVLQNAIDIYEGGILKFRDYLKSLRRDTSDTKITRENN